MFFRIISCAFWLLVAEISSMVGLEVIGGSFDTKFEPKFVEIICDCGTCEAAEDVLEVSVFDISDETALVELPAPCVSLCVTADDVWFDAISLFVFSLELQAARVVKQSTTISDKHIFFIMSSLPNAVIILIFGDLCKQDILIYPNGVCFQ